MLTKAKLEMVRNLHALVRTPQWKSVDSALHDELQATYVRMQDTPDTAALHELRGRARILSELLELTRDTQGKLEALSKVEARRRP
jgi:hypothetical protein